MIDSLTVSADTLIYNEKLSNLYPIFIPDPIKFEFVTPGWYFLLSLFLIILIFIFIQFYKTYKKNQYRRDTVNQLMLIRESVDKSSNDDIINQVSSLLKLASFRSYGRDKTANLTGENWKKFLLQKLNTKIKHDSFDLFSLQYSKETNNISKDSLNRLIEASIIWVRRHRA